MPTTTKNVVFDVVGTCVSYDAFYTAIETRLGPRLLAAGIKPRLLGYAWQEAAEREYTYLSISGHYLPFSQVFQPLFFRMLHMAGISNPREFASDEDSKFMVDAYGKLDVREGVKECFERLRGEGFTVWALTSGDRERVGGPLVEKLLLGGGETPWFAAAHTWDAGAAKRNGFRSAWCSVLEKEQCVEIFGEADVVADTLPELADKIIAASK